MSSNKSETTGPASFNTLGGEPPRIVTLRGSARGSHLKNLKPFEIKPKSFEKEIETSLGLS